MFSIRLLLTVHQIELHMAVAENLKGNPGKEALQALAIGIK